MSSLPRTPEPEIMDSAEEAAGYDSMDHSAVNQQFVDDLQNYRQLSGTVDQGDLKPNVMLDVGAGTGRIPLLFEQATDRPDVIIALDMAPEMLKAAARNVSTTKPSLPIQFVLGSAARLPVATASCQVVMSNSLIHHVSAPIDVLREMRRVLTGNGVLFVRDLIRPESAEQVEHFVDLYAAHATAYQRQMLRQSLHAAFTVEEIGDALEAADLNRTWVQASSDRHWTIRGRLAK